ncbi:MAG TPA: peptidylprolyl isomerase [Vicinamibacterales bacterium]|nr:peptidylprolyl isomerase [Vicinamibacterales bacterium]
MRTLVLCLLAALSTTMSARQPTSLQSRMIVAEDGRAQSDAELATLRQGLTSRDPNVRQQAVRAMGRLERPDLIPPLTRSLGDANVNVRIEAANAVGQLAKGAEGVTQAKGRLLTRARVEQEPRAWGAVAATLGRLAYTTAADVEQVETALARVLPNKTSTVIQIDAVLGATEGLEALARQSGKISRLKPATLDGLRAAAVLEGRAQDADKMARIRRLATLALTAAGAATRPQLEAGIADADHEVRRLTMIAARADVEGREAVIARGLIDPHPQVRYEALQTWGRQLQKTSCEPVLKAVRDEDAHVVLLAIDLLGNGCPAPGPAIETVKTLAEGLASTPGAWHRAAHAVVSLAKLAPSEARARLPRFIGHDVWQVRMYAARAAGALASVEDLSRLGRDVHHNVREAAIGELVTLKRPEAAALALDALSSSDYQLVMTAARALSTADDRPAAVAALGKTFERIDGERKDTARDALNAIRDSLAKLGGPELPEPVRYSPAKQTFPADRLASLALARLRFTMAGRGSFELRLLPDLAPLTASHIATLAQEGYYNGLTFHRVAPNFVIQGGSPGANEYAGQGPYMRDEVGLVSHRRATVGISTRGRDTGDAQIFINLVDSPRLDHTYTVFAEVTSGMEVVDQILEGDVIERVDVISPKS